jgi:hypothetical protein
MHPSACRHCYPSPKFTNSKPSYQEVYITGDASGDKLEKTIQEAEVAGYVPGVMGVWVPFPFIFHSLRANNLHGVTRETKTCAHADAVRAEGIPSYRSST